METTYKWEIKEVSGKPTFTDKHGNVRENVLKKVYLQYVGQRGDETAKADLIVNFDLTDLSTFTDYTQLTAEDVIQLALSVRHPMEIKNIEESVKVRFGDDANENNVVLFQFE